MMSKTIRSFYPALVIVAAAAPACAGLTPPLQNAGPATSREGIELAVTGQSCSQTKEPDWYGDDLVETTVQVQVKNVTPEPLTVHRDGFRLITPDGYALRTVTWKAIEPLTVAGGETRAFPLRFMTRGSLQCAQEMRIDAGAGVTAGEKPVKLGPVEFVPSRATS